MNRASLLRSLFYFSSATLALGQSLTPVQTINFNSFGDGTYTDLDGSSFSISATEPFSGFTQFNPALGTLTEIRITAEIRTVIDVSIESSELVDPEGATFSLFLDDGDSFVQTDIAYRPGGGSTGISVAGEFGGFGGLGVEDEDPSSYGAPSDFYFFDTTSDEFGGFAFEGNSPTSGSIFVTDPDFQASDFIGTGTVVGLELITFAQIDTVNALLDNIAAAFVEVTSTVDAGSATLQYVYTPVPEPASVGWLTAIIALTAVLQRRRSFR